VLWSHGKNLTFKNVVFVTVNGKHTLKFQNYPWESVSAYIVMKFIIDQTIKAWWNNLCSLAWKSTCDITKKFRWKVKKKMSKRIRQQFQIHFFEHICKRACYVCEYVGHMAHFRYNAQGQKLINKPSSVAKVEKANMSWKAT
jgi:hypothetical protein